MERACLSCPYRLFRREAIAFNFKTINDTYRDSILLLIAIKGDPSIFETSNSENQSHRATFIKSIDDTHFYYAYNIGDPSGDLAENTLDLKRMREMIEAVPNVVESLTK